MRELKIEGISVEIWEKISEGNKTLACEASVVVRVPQTV